MPLPSPFKYEFVFNYNTVLGTPGWTITGAAKDYASSVLPGVRIMRALDAVRRVGDTPRQLVEGLYMVFTEQSRSLGWQWLPATMCMNARLVDGVLAAAECGAYASGMFAIARAPHPFGLGIPAGNGTGGTIKVEQYSGDNRLGFVAVHPSVGVLGLMPNVLTHVGAVLPGELRGASLYLWANHKVVRYNDQLFDPTYGCQYEQLDSMACLQIVDWEILGAPKPATLDAFENSGLVDPHGKHLYICEHSATSTRLYIRFTPTALRGSENKYQGPFTKHQRDALEQALAIPGASTAPPIPAATVFGY